jgi:hypothetical protein
VLPTLFGVIVLVALIVLLMRRGVGTFSSWADISLIFLLIPLLIVGLIIIGILVALLVLAIRLYGEIPHLAYQAYRRMLSLRSGARRVSGIAAKPFFILSAARAGIKEGLRSIRLIFNRP